MIQSSPAAVGRCSLTNCPHIFGLYYKSPISDKVRWILGVPRFYKHSTPLGKPTKPESTLNARVAHTKLTAMGSLRSTQPTR